MIQTILTIKGMSCGMCESHINDAIRQAFPIKKVTSSRRKETTEILSEAALDEAQLRDLIQKTGYDLVAIESHPYEKKSLFGKK